MLSAVVMHLETFLANETLKIGYRNNEIFEALMVLSKLAGVGKSRLCFDVIANRSDGPAGVCAVWPISTGFDRFPTAYRTNDFKSVSHEIVKILLWVASMTECCADLVYCIYHVNICTSIVALGAVLLNIVLYLEEQPCRCAPHRHKTWLACCTWDRVACLECRIETVVCQSHC